MDGPSEPTRAGTEEPTDPYAALADWYDTEHDGLVADVECFAALLARLGGRRCRVAEVGSGSGRVALGLALAGHAVVGVEPSAAMRARCSRRLSAVPQPVARRVRVVPGTATAPNLPDAGTYDCVLYALNTLAHLLDATSRVQALTAAAALLCPGGLLVVDTDLTGLRDVLEGPPRPVHQGTWSLPSGRRVVHAISAVPGALPATAVVAHRYREDGAGAPPREVIVPMTMALVPHEEVRAALPHAGLEYVAAYADYTLEAPAVDPLRAVLVARRPLEAPLRVNSDVE